MCFTTTRAALLWCDHKFLSDYVTRPTSAIRIARGAGPRQPNVDRPGTQESVAVDEVITYLFLILTGGFIHVCFNDGVTLKLLQIEILEEGGAAPLARAEDLAKASAI